MTQKRLESLRHVGAGSVRLRGTGVLPDSLRPYDVYQVSGRAVGRNRVSREQTRAELFYHLDELDPVYDVFARKGMIKTHAGMMMRK